MQNMIKKRLFLRLSIAAGILMLLSMLSVTADYGTHLNITMVETVYQNTTFAESFDLVESQKSCMSEGILTIDNTNTEDIFDIYLKLTNIGPLDTDFIWSSGKDGSQISGGTSHAAEYGLVGNTTNNVTISYDLDNDGFFTDYVWVNSTHVMFNLSSDPADIISIRLMDTGVPVTINAGGVDVNMTEVAINRSAPGSREYGNLTIIGTTAAGYEIDAAMTFTINEHEQTPIIIYIPELRSGNSSTFVYNISCMGTDPPVNIDTTYENPRTGYNKKVLAGYNWTVIQNVTNANAVPVDITNINITITAAQVRWNDTLFNFSLLHLNDTGDWTNVSTAGGLYQWTWAPNGGTLTPAGAGSTANITYVVGAPESVPFTATYLAIEENVSYRLNSLLSNISLVEVNASSDMDFSFEKKIERPADNYESHNVTWEIIPNVSVPYNITYNLNKVTVWVTQNKNPLNHTDGTIWGRLEKNYTAGFPMEVNLSLGWGGSGQKWSFNYSDGYNASYPPPIVWMKPEWIITNKFGQIMNYTSSVSGSDWYLKYIYVVHGYWLEIQKNVTNIGEGEYQIYTYVENIGNGWTPEFEKVTVYDFVPNEFEPWDWSLVPNSNQSIGTPGSDYYGTAFVWDIGWKGTMNSSLGPKNGPYATGWQNYSWNVSYKVNGSGQYKVTELYIVGLDPLRVDGAFTSPIITIIAGIQSYSNELIYISVVAFLIIVNITNLVMTNRIHQKLSQRLPPPPKPGHRYPPMN